MDSFSGSWELSHEIKSKGLIYPRASHEVDSKPKQNIFGERYAIGLDKCHALTGAAIVVKHIRNALVHSYCREVDFCDGEA